jgi:hemerythrin
MRLPTEPEANVTLLTWGYACAVGVRAMDDQHGILMDTLNELRMAGVEGRGREQMSGILDRLIAYTRTHFEGEEQLMERAGFPGLDTHRGDHHRILAELVHAGHLLQYGEKLEFHPLFCRLRDSYIEHIEGPDRAYGPWLNERGVS